MVSRPFMRPLNPIPSTRSFISAGVSFGSSEATWQDRKLVLAFEHLCDREVPIVAIIPATRGVDKEVPEIKACACIGFQGENQLRSACDSSKYFVCQPRHL